MNLDVTRQAMLALVSEYLISFTQDERNVAVWNLDGCEIRDGRAFRDLWWLWEAGLIEFTRAGYPTAVRLTETGRQHLM